MALIDAQHLDAMGQPDPRTPAHLEAHLLESGGQVISAGLIQFDDSNQVHQVKRHSILCLYQHLIKSLTSFLWLRQALMAMGTRHAWVRHNDASHAAAGDVVISCVLIAWSGKKFVFEHLTYFKW